MGDAIWFLIAIIPLFYASPLEKISSYLFTFSFNILVWVQPVSLIFYFWLNLQPFSLVLLVAIQLFYLVLKTSQCEYMLPSLLSTSDSNNIDWNRCVLLGVSCGANIADYVACKAVESVRLLDPIKVVAQVLMYPFFIGSVLLCVLMYPFFIRF